MASSFRTVINTCFLQTCFLYVTCRTVIQTTDTTLWMSSKLLNFLWSPRHARFCPHDLAPGLFVNVSVIHSSKWRDILFRKTVEEKSQMLSRMLEEGYLRMYVTAGYVLIMPAIFLVCLYQGQCHFFGNKLSGIRKLDHDKTVYYRGVPEKTDDKFRDFCEKFNVSYCLAVGLCR